MPDGIVGLPLWDTSPAGSGPVGSHLPPVANAADGILKEWLFLSNQLFGSLTDVISIVPNSEIPMKKL